MTLDIKREAYEAHHAKFDCSHEAAEVRMRPIKNGYQYTAQCLRCGEPVGNPIAKVKAQEMHFGEVPDWDIALEQDWDSRRRISAEAASKAGDAEFWEGYGAYLKSDKWREKRRLVLQRDKGICQGCLSAPATQVHHLSYKHVGRELLFELTSVCDACHEITHDDK